MTAPRHDWKRRLLAVAMIGAILEPLSALQATAAVPARFVGALGLAESLVWDGEHVALGVNAFQRSQTVEGHSLEARSSCDHAAGCRDYLIDVADGAAQMRVAVDLLIPATAHDPEPDKVYGLEVFDPFGRSIGSLASGVYSAEIFVCFAAAPCSKAFSGSGFAEFALNYEANSGGRWTIRFIPQAMHDWTYRMRAGLDAGTPAAAGASPLLPNLRATPPFEFTFAIPMTRFGPGAGAGRCHPTDVPDEPVGVLTRCLRFSAAVENAGPGQLDLRGVTDPADPSPTAYQHLLAADGTDLEQREAGEFAFHVAHGHWHYQGMLAYRLFAVVAGQTLMSVGAGSKVGWCPADERMVRWTEFTQSRAFIANDGQGDHNCLSPTAPGIAQSAGWADIYEWQRPEQIVGFSEAGDGRYVLRVTVDDDDGVLESDGDDNDAYAYIEVTGDAVCILERGYGTDPWDPAKAVADDFGSTCDRLSADSERRGR